MSTSIDARGLSCPQPLILLQKAINDGKKDIEITVDNETSLENIVRYVSGKFSKTPAVKTSGIESAIRVKL